MKTAIPFVLAFLLIFMGCSQQDPEDEMLTTANLSANEFSQAQMQIEATLLEIFTSIQEKDADKLISFHAYGPKFTEFKDGERRTGSVENEKYERGLVSSISGFEYDLNDLKIDVFQNNVGKVTFHADFRPTIDGQEYRQVGQVTLIFIRDGRDWKIVHEHFSPLKTEL